MPSRETSHGSVSAKCGFVLAILRNQQPAKWEVPYRKSESILADADHLIAELANDIGLTKENLHKAVQ